MLNAIPRGRLIWFWASHHCDTHQELAILKKFRKSHRLAVAVDPPPCWVARSTKSNVTSSGECEPAE